MPSRQPGRRAIIVGSIMGLCIALIWVATFRVLYLNTHPLGAWEQSTCRDTAADVSNTPTTDAVLISVQGLAPPGGFRGAGIPTRVVMCALRTSDGALVRRFLLPGREGADTSNPIFSVLRQVGDKLYIAEGVGRICAIHVSDGERLWCHATQAPLYRSELIVADGVVFSKSSNLIEAFDARDGTPLWHDNLYNNINTETNQAQTFAVSGGTVYVGRNDPTSGDQTNGTLTFCARASRAGTIGWCRALGTGKLALARVELGDDTIFAIVRDLNNQQTPLLYALRISDGKALWQRQFDCASPWTLLTAYVPDANTASRGTLLLAKEQCGSNAGAYPSRHNDLLALRAGDGTPLWAATLGPLADLAVADGIVYLDSPEIVNGESAVRTTTILALRTVDASQAWRIRIPTLAPRLALTGNIVVALTGDFPVAATSPAQTMYALRRTDGSELWRSAGCDAPVDPVFWHDHILQHEQGAPVWCHWPAMYNSTGTLTPVLQ
jgi:outer membrane protein assembly factor BamB